MNIVPKLNLNRNPKDIPNGSLVAAKNMMIDDTGSYFTNEYGFKVAFECQNEGEYICGAISCINEVIIFTYQRLTNTSRIYRKKDNNDAIEVNTNWKYNNGEIKGSYTYNYKGELIIAVSEINAKDINDNEIKVPLKCWNLDDCNNNLLHSVEEVVPKISISYETVNGSLNCGSYTFFIRYKISDKNYTKWFQLTDEVLIINNDTHGNPTHVFLTADSKSTTWYNNGNIYGATEVANLFDPFTINGNAESNKGVCINLDINNDDYKFEEYQIGYIVKHDNEVLGRIFNNYDISIKTILFTSNSYIEEESVDEFVKEPNQYYNVKNLINYNNRLYIAGYEEYNNVDLSYYTKYVKCRTSIDTPKDNQQNTITSKKLRITVSTPLSTSGSYTGLWDNYTKNDDGTYNINSDYHDEFMTAFFGKGITVAFCGRTFGIDGKQVVNNPNGYGREPYSVTVSYELWITNKNHKDICVYDGNAKKARNITKITIEDSHIVIYATTGVKYIIGGTDTSCNLFYTLYASTSHGTVKETAFLGQNLTYEGQATTMQATWNLHSQVVNCETIYDLTTETPYNNYKSLIPGQIYAFYIHYIRKDGSATNGFVISNDSTTDTNVAEENGYFDLVLNDLGNKLFRTPNPTKDNTLVFAKFTVDKIPEDYIGYFISYEKVEDNVYTVIATETNECTSTSFEYKLDTIQGVYSFNLIGSTSTIKEKKHTNQLRLETVNTRHPYITSTTGLDNLTKGSILGLYTDNKSIYTKSNKTLYRFTDNYYDVGTTTNYYKYIPSFYNKEKVVIYDKHYIMNPSASNVISENEKVNSYFMRMFTTSNYSKFPYNACSIKQDYNEGSVSLVNDENKTLGVYYNKVLSPDRLRDFIELKSAYISSPNKSYTNYSKSYIDTFNKTVRRSNVVSDESLLNGFRQFNSEEYKIIKENKGDITNLVGIGFYLLVHTEYSLFVFDRSPQLTQKSQLQIPDTFDIDYQEVLPSNEGFGGLRSNEESIITKNGYIWFDYNNNIIFKYENGKASVLSSDINNFIKDVNIDTVRFGEDLYSNRLLICIYIKANNDTYPITLSYNFNTNTFISMHDYSFTNCYRTYNNAYYFDSNKDKSRLYAFDKSSNKYYNLTNSESLYYPKL